MSERIRLSRQRGWRMPEGAVKVDRSTKWGNPFALRQPIERDSPLWPHIARLWPHLDEPVLGGVLLSSVRICDAEAAVTAYSWWILEQPHLMLSMAEELGGRALVDLIIDETVTCYEGDRSHRHAWGFGCGECDACKLRARGWESYAASRNARPRLATGSKP